jgi:SOS response regulatory protein OraA/RecX
VDAVVRAALNVGCELDRPRARTLARELRRIRGLRVAVRALRARDHTLRSLDQRLEQRAVPPDARREVLATLAAAGVVDDERFAAARAQTLADRGWGDAGIAADLERRGVSPGAVAAAIGALEPEPERAGRVVAARGAGAKTARHLVARGFDPELAAEAAGAVVAPDD